MIKDNLNKNNKKFINKKNKSHSSKYIFKTEQNQNPIIKRNQFINSKYNKNDDNIYRSLSLDDKKAKTKELNDNFGYVRNYNSLNDYNTRKSIYNKKNNNKNEIFTDNKSDESLNIYSIFNKNRNLNNNQIYISKNKFIKTEGNNNSKKINPNEIKRSTTTVYHQNFEKIKNRMTDLLDIYSDLLYNKISNQMNNEIIYDNN